MGNIRNFSIIAHVDHGKSTLADRFLELTGTIPKEKMRPQYLDMMELERERGITIKMQPVRMIYNLNLKSYILNLIDTPGHVDFSYEVSRSLAAVEGAILLVDATKGIQAQTIANLELARRQNLAIIPVVNKIDSAQARIKETRRELSNLLEISEVEENSSFSASAEASVVKEDKSSSSPTEPRRGEGKDERSSSPFAPARVNEIFEISAKYGTNVEKLLEAIIKKIPCPVGDNDKPLRALIFDFQYDFYKGVIAFLRIFDGEIKMGDKIYLIQSKSRGEAKEVGVFGPELKPMEKLSAGEIGYLATGIKELGKVRVGDTLMKISNFKFQISNLKPLPGYEEPKPVVFISIYPENSNDFDLLKTSLTKLKLNDPSLTFEPERTEGLGRGYLCGFLGTLHAEIIVERLSREYNLALVISAPQVLYKVINKEDRELLIKSATDWPPAFQIKEVKEPWVKLKIITPQEYLGQVLKILQNFEGKPLDSKYFGQNRLLVIYEAPLRTIMAGFYDKLKGVSQGFASMDYQMSGYKGADLVKLEILIAGEKQEVFSKIAPKKEATIEGKRMVKKLKEILPPQLFSVPLQAMVQGKIIARETIRAKGKDVIAPLYGGDYTRKRKLLEKQKKGKKELKEKGKLRLPQNIFFELFKSE